VALVEDFADREMGLVVLTIKTLLGIIATEALEAHEEGKREMSKSKHAFIDGDLAEHLNLEATRRGITFTQAYNEEMDAIEELDRIAHTGIEITPSQPPQSWYDE